MSAELEKLQAELAAAQEHAERLREACQKLLNSGSVQRAWPMTGGKRAEKPGDTFSQAAATVKFRDLLRIHQALAAPSGQRSPWLLVSEQLPVDGQIIACKAKHKDGDSMYWAGVVIEIQQGLALMETRGDRDYRFILTPDTHWMPLPHAFETKEAA